jgi:hypothetical protein
MLFLKHWGEDKIKVFMDMTKRRKKAKPEKPHSEQDHFLLRMVYEIKVNGLEYLFKP